jgi:hypothetical protein
MIWTVLAVVFSLTLQSQDAAAQSSADPTSLARIREALMRQSMLRLTIPEPTFRVTIQDRTPFTHMFNPLDLKGGPTPPGGLYAFEQRQRFGNPWAGQPMFQFNVLPAAQLIIQSVDQSRRAQSQRAAHEEMLRELAEFCIHNICEPTVDSPKR